MRILLVTWNVYTEYTSGAARSVRTVMEWLAASGHACRVLSTGCFESSPDTGLGEHLATLGIQPRRNSAAGPCPVASYELADVAVTVLDTRHNAMDDQGQRETLQFLELFHDLSRQFLPNVVLTYGGHPALRAALHIARERGACTIRTVRAYGYEDRGWFDHVDRVLTCGPYLTRHYREQIGLASTPIPSPIVWSDVQAPETAREYVTFINPSLHKGVVLFARLADMLARARPDIPILVVQSAGNASASAAIDELQLVRHPQIVFNPPLPKPRDIFGLTKILLVPSLFQEPFGRVAAEAMINGIPALVSDRGGLPETVDDGGIVLPVPAWMQPDNRSIPEPAELQPWFDAVVRLWDDATEYRRVAGLARAAARRLYDEGMQRTRYAAYFAAPPPYDPLFP